MPRALNPREKRLLAACLVTLFLVINFLALREFNMRRTNVTTGLSQLREQVASNQVWLGDRAFWEKRKAWLESAMPYTDSAGKSQGQLLELLQNTALDMGLTVSNTTLLEPLALDYANEVGVTVRVRGPQDVMLRWLLTLQSPERFQAVKNLELELDSRARETTPQAQCNLTVARWFNPNPPANQPAPAVVPSPVTPASEAPAETPVPATDQQVQPQQDAPEEPVNPLDLGSPI